MRRLFFPFVLAIPLLAACALGLPTTGGSERSAPAAADEITVTSLDTPAAGASAVADAATAPPLTATAQAAATAPGMTEAQVALVASGAPLPADVTAAPAEAAAVQPPVLKSPEQIACEKTKGRFVQAGATSGRVCVHQTRDGGKTCRKESDCEGLCLARSGTCSPVTPLFGCQEIFQQDGLRLTECVE